MIDNVKDSTLKVILKYKEHPSILAVQNKCKDRFQFVFEEMDFESIENEIHNLKISTAFHNSDISAKTKKENVDIFAEINEKAYIAQLNLPLFLHTLNQQMWLLYSKKAKNIKKTTTDLWAFYQLFLNVLKNSC